MPTHCERYIGTLLGGCIGDILGSTNEGKTFDFIRTKNSYVTKFCHNRYTDDTRSGMYLGASVVSNRCKSR